MLYSTRKQTEHFEEALVELGVLGLLEIEGQKLLRESVELQEETGDQPAEKTLDAVKRGLWKQKQKTRIARAAGVIRPVFVRAAVVFFAVFLGAGSMLITSAEAREYVYQLVFTVHDRYSEVVIPESSSDEAVKNCKEYQVTFVPQGYYKVLDTADEYGAIYGYFNDEEDFFTVTILQLDDPESQTIRFDTEDADSIQPIRINESLGLMILKQGDTQIVWQDSSTYFSVASDLPSETVIKIAEGIRSSEETEILISDKTESQQQSMYKITYVPEGFALIEQKTNTVDTIYVYKKEDNFIIISATKIIETEDQTIRFDTEDADSIQPIHINKSLGLMILKHGRTQIVWRDSSTYFSVASDLPGETVIKIAEGIV